MLNKQNRQQKNQQLAEKEKQEAEAAMQKAYQAVAQARSELAQLKQDKEAAEQVLFTYNQRVKELEGEIAQTASQSELTRLQQAKRDAEKKVQQAELARLNAEQRANRAETQVQELERAKKTAEQYAAHFQQSNKELERAKKAAEQYATNAQQKSNFRQPENKHSSLYSPNINWQKLWGNFVQKYCNSIKELFNFIITYPKVLAILLLLGIGIYFYQSLSKPDQITNTKNNITKKTDTPTINTPTTAQDNLELAMQYKKQKDWDNALKYFEKAAPNNRIALYEMARINRRIKKNYTLALQQYNQFIDDSLPTIRDELAMRDIAIMYHNGTGVTKNKELAIKYYQKLIDNNTILSEPYTKLADLISEKYDDTDITKFNEKKYDEQEQILLKGANLGLLRVQSYLQQLSTLKGLNLVTAGFPDESKEVQKTIFYWEYKIASNLDYNKINHKKYNFDGLFTKEALASSQYMTGSHYQNGFGVKKDIEEAKYWYKIAHKNGNKNAKVALDNLNTK